MVDWFQFVMSDMTSGHGWCEFPIRDTRGRVIGRGRFEDTSGVCVAIVTLDSGPELRRTVRKGCDALAAIRNTARLLRAGTDHTHRKATP